MKMTPCPSCGSRRVTIEPFDRMIFSISFIVNFLQKIFRFKEFISVDNKRPMGKYVIKCNDCGKNWLIYYN
jgi:DNA-directed RNA polymerase subunit RPC12/RpoP